MEKALVSAAVGFAIAILMAIASVELIGIDTTFSSTLMGGAMVVAAGVAGLLVVALQLDNRERSRIRRARVAAASGEAPTEDAAHRPAAIPMQTVAWPASPHEVVIAAPTATAWTEADAELPGVSSRGHRRRRSQERPLLVRIVRHGEWSIPSEWCDTVEQADFDAMFLDPRAHDPIDPNEPDADLVGHRAQPAAATHAA